MKKEGVNIYTERYSDFASAIAQYEKEMRRLFEQQEKPQVLKSEALPEPAPVPMPIPVPEPAKSEEPPKEQTVDFGSVIVEVTTARGAIPLEGVTVVISSLDFEDSKGRKELIKIEQTGSEGRTKPVALPTVNKDLSLTPGNNEPFSTVYVSAQTRGYFPVKDRPVDIFMDETSILKIDLVPKPENLKGEML